MVLKRSASSKVQTHGATCDVAAKGLAAHRDEAHLQNILRSGDAGEVEPFRRVLRLIR